MKKLSTGLLLLIAGYITLHAQEATIKSRIDSTQPTSARLFGDKILSLGAQIGTDIGGAVPYPLKYIPSPMNAYPQINGAIGAKFGFPLYGQFSLGLECSYKRIAMNADARVENQKFQGESNGENVVQYFSGSAEMNMSFTLLEIPLYVKYQLGKGPHKVCLGGYYAYIFSPKFETLAKKGYVGMQPDRVGSIVSSEDPLLMNFSEEMDRWDAGIMLGYEVQILSRLNAGIRFSMGFKDIFKPESQYFEYKMLHMRGSIVVSYDLFNFKI